MFIVHLPSRNLEIKTLSSLISIKYCMLLHLRVLASDALVPFFCHSFSMLSIDGSPGILNICWDHIVYLIPVVDVFFLNSAYSINALPSGSLLRYWLKQLGMIISIDQCCVVLGVRLSSLSAILMAYKHLM